jgi:hypothetical protein
MREMSFVLVLVIFNLLSSCQSDLSRENNVESSKQIRSNKNTPVNEEELIKAQEAFLEESEFKKEFFYNATGKKWHNVDVFYTTALQQYASAQYLDVLKSSLIASLAGEPHQNLKISYDGTLQVKQRIEYYANEIKNLQTKEPIVVLYFIKELQKFWTSNEVKEYAQEAVSWNTQDYPIWKNSRDKLQETPNLGVTEQLQLQALQNIVTSFEEIQQIADL